MVLEEEKRFLWFPWFFRGRWWWLERVKISTITYKDGFKSIISLEECT